MRLYCTISELRKHIRKSALVTGKVFFRKINEQGNESQNWHCDRQSVFTYYGSCHRNCKGKSAYATSWCFRLFYLFQNESFVRKKKTLWKTKDKLKKKNIDLKGWREMWKKVKLVTKKKPSLLWKNYIVSTVIEDRVITYWQTRVFSIPYALNVAPLSPKDNKNTNVSLSTSLLLVYKNKQLWCNFNMDEKIQARKWVKQNMEHMHATQTILNCNKSWCYCIRNLRSEGFGIY